MTLVVWRLMPVDAGDLVEAGALSSGLGLDMAPPDPGPHESVLDTLSPGACSSPHWGSANHDGKGPEKFFA